MSNSTIWPTCSHFLICAPLLISIHQTIQGLKRAELAILGGVWMDTYKYVLRGQSVSDTGASNKEGTESIATINIEDNE